MINSINGSQLANNLFSRVDTKSKGYLEQSDLESLFSSVNQDSSKADAVFTALDSDQDGKVTKSEFSAALDKVSSQLNNQFDQMRIKNGTPPPPPNDSGFTKEELQNQLSSTDISSDTKRTSLISNIVKNFDAADTNKDGKVSASEAAAYQKSQSSSTSDMSSTETSDSQSLRQIVKLLEKYNISPNSSSITAEA